MELSEVTLILLGIIGSNFLWFLAGMCFYKKFIKDCKKVK